MEKKNMVLLTVIAIATLLVAVVGATFAYFTANVQNSFGGSGTNNEGNTNVSTGTVKDEDTFVIAEPDANAGSFTATDAYPGHKEVAAIKVSAKNANNTPGQVKLTYTPSANDFADDQVKISLYKGGSGVDVSADNFFNCTKGSAPVDGDPTKIKFYETCTKSETDLTGATLVETTKYINGTTPIVLATSETVASSAAGTDTYFYVVVEVENKDESQDEAAGGKALTGKISVELV